MCADASRSGYHAAEGVVSSPHSGTTHMILFGRQAQPDACVEARRFQWVGSLTATNGKAYSMMP